MISIGFLAAMVFFLMSVLVVWHFVPCMKELNNALDRVGEMPLDYCPEARVILCLRGADPFLDRCLRGLANQDYPNYKVLIVVDSQHDEALPQVRRLLGEYGPSRVEMLFRDRILPRCSRRASSLFSGLQHVSDDVEVVVMCDADAIPHSTWLRELVAPLKDSQTVAASGNRWYSPLTLTLGGVCRYLWNALAFRTMYKYRIPWCGSLAMRRDLFRDPEFQDCLQHAFSEDTALAGFLAKRQQRAVPIVSLVMLNEETIGLKNFWGFLVRQMLAARLNDPNWFSILGEAMVILLLIWVAMPLAILQGPESFSWWLAGGVVFDISVLATVGQFELMVRRFLWRSRRQRCATYDWNRILVAPLAFTVMGLVYPMAVVVAALTRHHEWRGIVYRVEQRGVATVRERQRYTSLPTTTYESV